MKAGKIECYFWTFIVLSLKTNFGLFFSLWGLSLVVRMFFTRKLCLTWALWAILLSRLTLHFSGIKALLKTLCCFALTKILQFPIGFILSPPLAFIF